MNAAPENRIMKLKSLWPQLNEAELIDADDTLTRYLTLILQLHERLRNDPESYAQFSALTRK